MQGETPEWGLEGDQDGDAPGGNGGRAAGPSSPGGSVGRGRCGTRGGTQPGERPELPFLRCKVARVAAGCLEAAQGLREG